jgi:hypothetical protein
MLIRHLLTEKLKNLVGDLILNTRSRKKQYAVCKLLLADEHIGHGAQVLSRSIGKET